MYPEPLHTRFRLAPSGDVHIGHAALGWLSMNAARVTGGTFTMRVQQLWATRDPHSMDLYRKHAHENIEQLIDLGIEPSHADAFKAHGMSPSWRIQFTDDRALIDYYWRELGFEGIWGEWPAEPAMAHALQDAETPQDWHSWYLAHCARKHPYIQFAQMVGEVTTGRNCLIRGCDHKADESLADAMYPLIAKKHYGLADIDRTGRYTPVQFFMPHIEVVGVGKISSSSGATAAGFYVKDVLAAKVRPERLFAYLGKVLFGSVEAAQIADTDWSQQIPVDPAKMHLRPMAQAGARSVMERMVPRPVIDAEDWARFLRTGDVER